MLLPSNKRLLPIPSKVVAGALQVPPPVAVRLYPETVMVGVLVLNVRLKFSMAWTLAAETAPLLINRTVYGTSNEPGVAATGTGAPALLTTSMTGRGLSVVGVGVGVSVLLGGLAGLPLTLSGDWSVLVSVLRKSATLGVPVGLAVALVFAIAVLFLAVVGTTLEFGYARRTVKRTIQPSPAAKVCVPLNNEILPVPLKAGVAAAHWAGVAAPVVT